jgi:restriction endonuclease S subunit
LLKDISKKIVDGPFGSSVKSEDYVENGIPFLRVADITHGDGTIELDGLIYISPEKHQEISRSTVFPNDVVIAKTGATMGAASVVPETIPEANIRGDLAAVIVNDVLLANYIVNFINTQIGQDLFWRLNSGATRGRVVISNLRKYPLIMPDVEKMAEINQFVDAAKTKKNKKEAEAAALLASIDGYLLQELGITLPPPSEKKTFFIRRSNHLTGMRFDPFYHQVEYEELEQALLNGKYPLKKLDKLINSIASGSTPKSGGDDYTNEGNGVAFIRVTNLKNNTIKFDNALYIKREIHEKMLKRTQLKQGDVLISMAGTIGLSVVVPEILEANINQAIAKMEVNSSIYNLYLSEFLNSFFGKKQTQKLSRPAVQTNISLDEIKQIIIPLPPPEKQTEIANHISALRTQAKQLQQQAAAELAQAKQHVEQLILGE